MQNSLTTPHTYEVTSFLTIGKNILAIRIDNRLDHVEPGFNSHSVTDHTQTNWNGIVGDITLQAYDNIYFKNVQVFPDAVKKSTDLHILVNNKSKESKTVQFTVSARLKNSIEEIEKKTV